jgi:hypothetical protein
LPQPPTRFAFSLAHDGLDTKINVALDALDTEDVRASGGGRWL